MTFAYFSILIVALLNLFCAASAKKAAHFTFADNHDPRTFLAHATGKAARLRAAEQNGSAFIRSRGYHRPCYRRSGTRDDKFLGDAIYTAACSIHLGVRAG